MAYTTLSALTERYGHRMLLQLTDRSNPPAGEVDESVVEQEIGNAEAAIDGYLAGRYKLPLASVPPLLRDLALAITIYKLHPFAPDPKIKDDYEYAMRQLREVADGRIRLPLEGVEPKATGGSGVITNDRDRPFTPDNLKGFV